MKKLTKRTLGVGGGLLVAMAVAVLAVSPAAAGDYDSSLRGVQEIKVVYDVSQGNPKTANVIFWAVKDMYRTAAVRDLPGGVEVAIVFHGPAVKLISTDRSSFKENEYGELDTFHATVKELKKDGVKMEICLYAARMMGVDPATILPEIDHVPNGFVSIAGYQAQGYGVIRVP